MRLYLAVAMLMLAFVAYTEAQEHDQEQEQTVEQRFATFGNQMAEVSRNLAEKATATFEEIKTSKFAVDSRTWFQGQFDKIKEHFS